MKDAIIVFVLCILVLFTSLSCYISNQRNNLREEAVKRNFAEWVVDSKGMTAFRWKESR